MSVICFFRLSNEVENKNETITKLKNKLKKLQKQNFENQVFELAGGGSSASSGKGANKLNLSMLSGGGEQESIERGRNVSTEPIQMSLRQALGTPVMPTEDSAMSGKSETDGGKFVMVGNSSSTGNLVDSSKPPVHYPQHPRSHHSGSETNISLRGAPLGHHQPRSDSEGSEDRSMERRRFKSSGSQGSSHQQIISSPELDPLTQVSSLENDSPFLRGSDLLQTSRRQSQV